MRPLLLLMILLSGLASCEKETLSYQSGDLKINLKTGEKWLHEYQIVSALKKKNAPQFAIWIEDTLGNYLSTIFVTCKAGSEGWKFNKGNRRKEVLPHWCHQRGVLYPDGLYLPTKEDPCTDGITGATPVADKEFCLHLKEPVGAFVIKAEFNHSIDFNEYYPENSVAGDTNYSGGTEGSGQPAIVFADTIRNFTGQILYALKPMGHSSADGSHGNVVFETHTLTTALLIVEEIEVEIIRDLPL